MRQATALLAAEAPEDAAAFKAWLTGTGRRVAEAVNEGGFPGFSGAPTSDVEKATLAEIGTVLAWALRLTRRFAQPPDASVHPTMVPIAAGWP